MKKSKILVHTMLYFRNIRSLTYSNKNMKFTCLEFLQFEDKSSNTVFV